MKSDPSQRQSLSPRWALALAIPLVLLSLLLSQESGQTDDEDSPAADPFAVPENSTTLSLRLFMTRLMRMTPDGDNLDALSVAEKAQTGPATGFRSIPIR